MICAAKDDALPNNKVYNDRYNEKGILGRLFDSFYTQNLKNPLVVHFNCGPQIVVFIMMRYMATAWFFEAQKHHIVPITLAIACYPKSVDNSDTI